MKLGQLVYPFGLDEVKTVLNTDAYYLFFQRIINFIRLLRFFR